MPPSKNTCKQRQNGTHTHTLAATGIIPISQGKHLHAEQVLLLTPYHYLHQDNHEIACVPHMCVHYSTLSVHS